MTVANPAPAVRTPAPAPAAAPVAPTPAAVSAPVKAAPKAAANAAGTTSPIRGVAAKIVENMEASLSVPTATSVRAVPAKLLADNRIVINNHLRRGRGGKVSFTHLIGYAMVRALADHPGDEPRLRRGRRQAGRGHARARQPRPRDRPGQARTARAALVVARIKAPRRMDFAQFWAAYEDIVRRARTGKLTTEDFAGTTISLTNPGGIGTNHSVPRLMAGQGTIIGVGAMEYPAEFQGASDRDSSPSWRVSKIMTLTSTYDHRIIQGAQSGEFLRRMHQLLLGEDGFYDDDLRARCASPTSRCAGSRHLGTPTRARSTRPPASSS